MALSRSCGSAVNNGRCASTHNTRATSRITVPAFFRKSFARSNSRTPSERSVGHRYSGSSRAKGREEDLKIDDFNNLAVARAAINPRR